MSHRLRISHSRLTDCQGRICNPLRDRIATALRVMHVRVARWIEPQSRLALAKKR